MVRSALNELRRVLVYAGQAEIIPYLVGRLMICCSSLLPMCANQVIAWCGTDIRSSWGFRQAPGFISYVSARLSNAGSKPQPCKLLEELRDEGGS